MELPDDAPKPPLWPFLLGDLVFITAAAFLATRADAPLSTANIVGIIVCAGIGVALGLAPFIIGYTRTQDIQLRERQQALEVLVRTTATAVEQASIAANGLHEIAEITKRNLHAIDTLPTRIDAVRNVVTADSETTSKSDLREELAQLRAAQSAQSDETKAAIDQLLTSMNTTSKKLSAEVEKIGRKLTIKAAKSAPEPKSEAKSGKEKTVAAKSTKAPKTRAPKKPTPTPEPSLFDELSNPSVEPSPTPVKAETKVVTKPAAETSTAPAPEPEPPVDVSSDAPAQEPTPDPVTPTPAPDPDTAENNDEPDDSVEEVATVVTTTDGVTQLTVTAYIGIGNRLFVRGDGPGLSWDEGTPLQFVSIGKWRWETEAAVDPVKLTLWKNDQEECTAVGEIELAPGTHFETSAAF